MHQVGGRLELRKGDSDRAPLPSGAERNERALVLEQPALARDAAAEARQLTARSHHAMTGYDDGDRVPAVRRAHGPARPRVAEAPRQGPVGGGRAVGDLSQQVPHTPLEHRARWRERQVEPGARAVEILAQLVARPREQHARGAAPVVWGPARERRGILTRGGEVDARDRIARRRDHEVADRTGDGEERGTPGGHASNVARGFSVWSRGWNSRGVDAGAPRPYRLGVDRVVAVCIG